MPAPRDNPGLFGQPTKPGKELKEILPDFRDPDTGFNEDFYQSRSFKWQNMSHYQKQN